MARPPALCGSCQAELELLPGGIGGSEPLPWWAAGPYQGRLRQQLLRLRHDPAPGTIAALARGIGPQPDRRASRPMLVPIPGWKRRPNPLPDLLAAAIGRLRGLRRMPLLERSRPVLGQHHLNRQQRLANQQGAFRCLTPPLPGQARRRPLLLVDDILTTGATALNAAAALELAGWRVAGLLVLARTP